MVRDSREAFKTRGNVFDAFTERNLFKLSSQGHFDEESLVPLSLGKEANIFVADRGEDKVIVKIYRLSSCDFNKMFEYIKQDTRYLKLQKNRRKVVFSWCQREYRNLHIARAGNVSVPTPYAFLANILVMECIGMDSPAPKLNKALPKDPKDFCSRLYQNMEMLARAKLVHGDLSSFNILNHNERPVLIDFSQAIPVASPAADQYLERDVRNTAAYFRRIGVKLNEAAILKRLLKIATAQ